MTTAPIRERLLVILNTVTAAMIECSHGGLHGGNCEAGERLDDIASNLEGVASDLADMLGPETIETEELYQDTVPLRWRFKVTK